MWRSELWTLDSIQSISVCVLLPSFKSLGIIPFIVSRFCLKFPLIFELLGCFFILRIKMSANLLHFIVPINFQFRWVDCRYSRDWTREFTRIPRALENLSSMFSANDFVYLLNIQLRNVFSASVAVSSAWANFPPAANCLAGSCAGSTRSFSLDLAA